MNRNNILLFNGCYFFGNTSTSISFVGASIRTKVYFTNSFFYGGTTFVQSQHWGNAGANPTVDTFYYNNCYFGYSDTSLTSSPFSTGALSGPLTSAYKIFSNCYFNTTDNISTGASTGYNMFGGFRSLNHNGVTASNREWTPNGVITTDTTIFLSGNKSIRLTPNSATFKLTSHLVRVPVKSGATCTISVNVRESITADGAVYNGTAPRLMYAFNPVLGNLTETVGAIPRNLLSFPQNFDNAYWVKTFTSVTPDSISIASPDGTFTADLVVRTNSSNSAFIQSAQMTATSNTYTVSIYAKLGVLGTNIGVRCVGVYPNRGDGLFNLSTGTLIGVSDGGTNTSTSGTITSVGNGWYRCTVTTTFTTLTTISVQYGPNNTTNVSTWEAAVIGALDAYIWGAQLVVGSTVLPYYENGQWEKLTYTTATFSSDGVAEFYVDCDGTTGWINIDDWSTTTTNDSRSQDYWGTNGVYIEPTYRTLTRSKTFTT